VEPTSATALVAAEQLAARNVIRPEHVVVVVVTSPGIKDPAAPRAHLPDIPLLQPDRKAFRQHAHTGATRCSPPQSCLPTLVRYGEKLR